MVMSTIEQRFESFRASLAAYGLAQVLELLNRDVPNRYSAVYRLKAGIFRKHLLFDKLDQVRHEYLPAVPAYASFRQTVFREGFFDTIESLADRRLDDYLYQGIVISYTGVPILDRFSSGSASGEIVGSLCHFDLVRHYIQFEEFELLQRVSRLITLDMVEQ
jgi:hypothetical protein